MYTVNEHLVAVGCQIDHCILINHIITKMYLNI